MPESKASGYLYRRELDDGREIVVYEMLFTLRLCVGPVGEGYERAWCYEPSPKYGVTALEAAIVWDGEGDPPDGWIKEVGTERRRVDGDPAREFDASTEPWPLPAR